MDTGRFSTAVLLGGLASIALIPLAVSIWYMLTAVAKMIAAELDPSRGSNSLRWLNPFRILFVESYNETGQLHRIKALRCMLISLLSLAVSAVLLSIFVIVRTNFTQF